MFLHLLLCVPCALLAFRSSWSISISIILIVFDMEFSFLKSPCLLCLRCVFHGSRILGSVITDHLAKYLRYWKESPAIRQIMHFWTSLLLIFDTILCKFYLKFMQVRPTILQISQASLFSASLEIPNKSIQSQIS